MKPFLTIDSEARLELSDLDSEDNKKIIFDGYNYMYSHRE